MANRKLTAYRKEVEQMVCAFYGSLPPHLVTLIRKTAQDMLMLDRFAEELSQRSLIELEMGSMGQQKQIANPLLPYYHKFSSLVSEDMYNLGLTARKQAAKDDTADRSAQDNIASLLADMKGGGV
ncbi:MAG: hypothetical protein J6U59_06165 [Alistipes sp.]|nr:hypothetical protein [Alistipes sp.]